MTSAWIEQHTLKANDDFAIIEEPKPHKQHPNQQEGLDLYISVLNLSTGEKCFKKMYENSKGLHFKHSGYSPAYLDDFNREIIYVPFQIKEIFK